MRIIIESDDTRAPAPVSTVTESSRTEATSAGPPAAALFQAAPALAEADTFREGIDAGGPPVSLVQALQSAAAPTQTMASGASEAGAAPNT
jgi:hypothetical protein